HAKLRHFQPGLSNAASQKWIHVTPTPGLYPLHTLPPAPRGLARCVVHVAESMQKLTRCATNRRPAGPAGRSGAPAFLVVLDGSVGESLSQLLDRRATVRNDLRFMAAEVGRRLIHVSDGFPRVRGLRPQCEDALLPQTGPVFCARAELADPKPI